MEDKYDYYDNNGEKFVVDVIRSGNFIHLGAHDVNNNSLGYLDSFFGDNKVYLDVIFCDPKSRNKGIASKLLETLSIISGNTVICGLYSPFGISNDKYEADKIAKSFYEKNGYEVITFTKYLENQDNYPSITESDFGVCHHSIIYKKEEVKAKMKIKLKIFK